MKKLERIVLNGSRNYNGNPLKYFREHKDVYEGMGREELSLFDPGLYRTLLRYGQLEKAIPFKKKSKGRPPLLAEKQVKKIIKAYKKYDGKAMRAAENSKHHANTFIKYWRREGLKIRGKGRPRKN